MRTSERCPSCKPPIVGTKPTASLDHENHLQALGWLWFVMTIWTIKSRTHRFMKHSFSVGNLMDDIVAIIGNSLIYGGRNSVLYFRTNFGVNLSYIPIKSSVTKNLPMTGRRCANTDHRDRCHLCQFTCDLFDHTFNNNRETSCRF